MKTRTEYQTEKKRLKVPKVEEFTISFTDGVSERLKVRRNEFINLFWVKLSEMWDMDMP